MEIIKYLVEIPGIANNLNEDDELTETKDF